MYIFRRYLLAKWDGTLPICVRHIYNWYLLEAYDLANMLDTFIGVWKCVEKILRQFDEKINFFREDMRKFQHNPRSEKWVFFLDSVDADEVGRYATPIHPTRI